MYKQVDKGGACGLGNDLTSVSKTIGSIFSY